MKSLPRLHQRQLVFIPVVATLVLQILLLGILALASDLSLVASGWMAWGLAAIAGLLLTVGAAHLLHRRQTKPIGALAASIRVATVNQQFDPPLVCPDGSGLDEIVDETNRMVRSLVAEQTSLQQRIGELLQLAEEKSTALQREVNAHKSAQEKLQTLARELDNRNRQLQLGLQQSQMADKAKAEFLASMSHEIRTPLNAVLGVASLLERSQLNERQRQQLGMIFESGKALLGILADIMDYVRIEAGDISLDEFPFNLDELGQAIITRHQEEAIARGLEYEYRFDTRLPKLYLGDGARVQQILNNLLDNAIKFTHQGKVSVHVSGVALQNRAYLIRIDVQDTGIGIADEMRDKLFEVFSQLDGASSRVYGGSGLGLAIASRLVKLMQGTLILHSEPGQGSLFRVELPLNLYQDLALAESSLETTST